MPTPADIILAGLSAQTQLGSQKIQVAYNQAHERDATMRGIADQLGKLPGLIQQGKAEKEEHDVNEAAAAGILSGDYDTAQKAIDNANTSTPQGARAKLILALKLDNIRQERDTETQKRAVAEREYRAKYVLPQEQRRIQMDAFANSVKPREVRSLQPGLDTPDKISYRSPTNEEQYDSLVGSGAFTPQDLVGFSRAQDFHENMIRSNDRGDRALTQKEQKDQENSRLRELKTQLEHMDRQENMARQRQHDADRLAFLNGKLKLQDEWKTADNARKDELMDLAWSRFDLSKQTAESTKQHRADALNQAVVFKLGEMLNQNYLSLNQEYIRQYATTVRQLNAARDRAKNPMDVEEYSKKLGEASDFLKKAIFDSNKGNPAFDVVRGAMGQYGGTPAPKAVDTKATTSELDKLLGINR